MNTYWDYFVSEYKNNILFEWTICQTLEHYTEWLAEQPDIHEYISEHKENKCICPEHCHDEACPVCIPGNV